ncbi:S41 family peptidase [Mycoplasma feriruminatoris]|uniref:Lipoprotein n=1 Tax=Mycoplasma feriruminatoris TaxID=1179777 RepID=A0AAQ3HWS3_9MOLU|nr:S41 family peptidase [Mycoplasma feriruminatoris]WFQ95307.1 lipoprotein [Mycoplasma feriruminatoris]
MKKAAIFLIPTLSLLLVGCNPNRTTTNKNKSNITANDHINDKNNSNTTNKSDPNSNITNVIYPKITKDQNQAENNINKSDTSKKPLDNNKKPGFSNLLNDDINDKNNKSNIETKPKITTEQNNKFQVLNTSYKLSSLISSKSLSNNTIKLTNYQDIDYIDLDQFFDLLKDILDINEKPLDITYNNNSYKLTKKLIKQANKNIIIIKLVNNYESNNKTKAKNFKLEEFISFDYFNQKVTISSVNFYNLINPYFDEDKLQYHISKKLESKPLVIDLNKYNIFIFNKNDNFYLPLIVLNQIFLAESERQLYFNQKEVFLFESYDVYDYHSNNTKTKLKSNKLNDQISSNLKEFQYNYLWFLLDNFYPIKLEKNQSYKTYLDKYKTNLLKDNLEHFKTTNLIIRDLNDIHTKVLLQSPIYDLKTSDSDLLVDDSNRTDRVAKFREYERELIKLSDNLDEKDVRYTNDKKTAIIKIDIFTRDTITGVKKQLEEIKNKNEVQNVVFDLTLNRGGSVPATYIILGFLTDQIFKYHKLYPNTNDKEILDIKSKIGKYNFKYYILNSPINYSAGNTFASISKTNKLAKIIGYQSAGGASEVRVSILPNGMIIRKSSLYTLTDDKWNSYEFGAKPDIEFDKTKGYDFKKLFDLNYIQTIINNDQKTQ